MCIKIELNRYVISENLRNERDVWLKSLEVTVEHLPCAVEKGSASIERTLGLSRDGLKMQATSRLRSLRLPLK